MSSNATYEKIMRDITAGLTGDNEADVKYLQEKALYYKDHELAKEIVRACGRLAYNLLPDNQKEAIGKVLDNDTTGIDAVLDEVQFNIYKGDTQKALTIMEPLIKQIEEADLYQDDQVSEYHTFNETFELLLFMYRNKPERETRDPSIPLSEIYWLYGCLLFELKRYNEARAALETALRWNPMSTKALFEYAEVFKNIGEMDTFLKLTLDAFKISFHKSDLARCYRNMGYYFIEKELYCEAYSSYLISGEFEENSKNMQSELYYISKVSNGEAKALTNEEFNECARKYGFPVGPDKEVIGLSYSYGKRCFDDNRTEPAQYYLGIAHDLTGDEKIKEMLDQIAGDEGEKEAD